jgi:hypothetical protein
MQMTLSEFTARFPDRAPLVPIELAGQWLAWDQNRTKIIAHGDDMAVVREQAVALGCPRPVLQKVPRAPFVGNA